MISRPDIAAFLNLTPDHLDRHRDIDGYFQAKMRLFEKIPHHGKAFIMGNNIYSQKAKEVSQNYYAFSDEERQKVTTLFRITFSFKEIII